MTTYRYPFKCMNCGLHYNVYSWESRWNKDHAAFCPECSTQTSMSLGVEHLKDQEIYQHVSALSSMREG